jgi:hypothetical protein
MMRVTWVATMKKTAKLPCTAPPAFHQSWYAWDTHSKG